jgi:type II secretory pathway component PulC
MLLIGVLLVLIEFLLQPALRFPTLFAMSPWLTIIWMGIVFAALLAISWRWIGKWCFDWRLVESEDST